MPRCTEQLERLEESKTASVGLWVPTHHWLEYQGIPPSPCVGLRICNILLVPCVVHKCTYLLHQWYTTQECRGNFYERSFCKLFK